MFHTKNKQTSDELCQLDFIAVILAQYQHVSKLTMENCTKHKNTETETEQKLYYIL